MLQETFALGFQGLFPSILSVCLSSFSFALGSDRFFSLSIFIWPCNLSRLIITEILYTARLVHHNSSCLNHSSILPSFRPPIACFSFLSLGFSLLKYLASSTATSTQALQQVLVARASCQGGTGWLPDPHLGSRRVTTDGSPTAGLQCSCTFWSPLISIPLTSRFRAHLDPPFHLPL